MKFHPITLAGLIAIALSSCSNLGSRSILEPISDSEEKELYDAGFHYNTFMVSEHLGKISLDESQRSYFGEITYRRASDYMWADQKWDTDEARREWSEIFQPKLDSVPAIVEKYIKEWEANYPENKYADVEWVKASLTGDGYVTDNADITIRITPKVPIEEFYLTYGLIDKENKADVFKFARMLNECNYIHSETMISGPTEFTTWLKFRDDEIEEEDFNQLSTSQLQDKYHFETIFRVKVAGEWHSKQEFFDSMPYYVQRYWEEENDGWSDGDQEFITRNLAEEYFGIKIPNVEDYVAEKRDEYLKEYDPLMHEAWELILANLSNGY